MIFATCLDKQAPTRKRLPLHQLETPPALARFACPLAPSLDDAYSGQQQHQLGLTPLPASNPPGHDTGRPPTAPDHQCARPQTTHVYHSYSATLEAGQALQEDKGWQNAIGDGDHDDGEKRKRVDLEAGPHRFVAVHVL